MLTVKQDSEGRTATGAVDGVDAAVAACPFGEATAVKRGRRAEWPYVPVIDHGTHTEQLRGLAYATRFEAVERARKAIVARQEALRYRALRQQFGLPREIGAAP